jgi:predicted neutral ceramidase superfamily lipid hydrolase
MSNLNTALISLWSNVATTKPNYILVLIFCLLIFGIFSQRIFNITSPYYILLATLIVLGVMLFIILSIFASNPQLTDNFYLVSINSVFDNPSSRNFLSVVALILFVMLVYEMEYYDNDKPNMILNKLMGGHNNYISNRSWGLMLILFVS